jgi:hypothetical protein
MAIRILPWDKLDNISKQKFNNEAEYLAFFRNTILPDTASKEKYISQIKEKVSEGVVWAKEFAKFHQRYKDGFPFKFDEKNTILNFGDQSSFLIKPQYAAYHNVRKIMRDWFIKKLKDEYNLSKPVIYLPPVALNQGESNFVTRRTKVAYLVYVGDLVVKDNLLYSVRNDKTLMPKPVSLSWCVSYFDKEYICDGVLTFPKKLGPLNAKILNEALKI